MDKKIKIFYGDDVIIEFTFSEWKIIKQLIALGLDFEFNSFELFDQVAIDQSENGILQVIDEMIEDEDEKKLLLELKNNKELVKKVRELVEK